ncbi:DUF3280 domain-containing protein [Xanthobacteraceae bacterium Astr-EGSB]|uniref:DUF3280 domain-containing protein n=1 Tax=Astrobacterium formosum TaxID=3069710 RepID=UPI0027B353B3|nr:DUF3280 domain-containing protein [Xanthobacteraceae bacterium Astr-EGSB]
MAKFARTDRDPHKRGRDGVRHGRTDASPDGFEFRADRGWTVGLIAIGCLAWSCAANAQEPVRIAVFDFELIDASAGGRIIAQDAVDTENLRASTEEARHRLATSGRFSVVDTSGIAHEVMSAGGIQHCNGCDGPLAKRLGARQSMIGVITRVNRTEYTLQIVVRDAENGAVVSNHFTGLRMGANYAWPRGVKWLFENQILAASASP